MLAPDAVRCKDGQASYERILHFALNGGRRSNRTHCSQHINTVNAAIGRFHVFMQPFCGPASKDLAAYGRWHVARNNANRSYLDAIRLLLASGLRTHTIF